MHRDVILYLQNVTRYDGENCAAHKEVNYDKHRIVAGNVRSFGRETGG